MKNEQRRVKDEEWRSLTQKRCLFFARTGMYDNKIHGIELQNNSGRWEQINSNKHQYIWLKFDGILTDIQQWTSTSIDRK